MIELKPCPLCGNNAEIKQTSKNGMRIKCKECVFGISQKVTRYSLEWLKDTLIMDWNTRPTEEKLKDRIALLEKVLEAAEYTCSHVLIPKETDPAYENTQGSLWGRVNILRQAIAAAKEDKT